MSIPKAMAEQDDLDLPGRSTCQVEGGVDARRRGTFGALGPGVRSRARQFGRPRYGNVSGVIVACADTPSVILGAFALIRSSPENPAASTE